MEIRAGEGALVVVGTGISAVGQLTTEAAAWIRRAEKVLCLVASPVAEAVLAGLNQAGVESLRDCYEEGLARTDSYERMVERVLAHVRAGRLTCFVLYGHPGIFAHPSHEAIRRARAEGYQAIMLPAVSALDCLFADLGVDPWGGCQSFEATDFLIRNRTVDLAGAVVLWQVGSVGDWTFRRDGYDLSPLTLLTERLCEHYPVEHTVTLYEAATLPGCQPSIVSLPLSRLPEAEVAPATTLYLPPVREPEYNLAMVDRLYALRRDARVV